MSLIIASQLEEGFNEALRALPVGPTVVAAPEARPWEAALSADILLARPSPAWRGARRAPAPPDWPGRLRWLHSASAGIDFYPDWMLAVPVVSCGRGVASEEIADYVIAAIYSHTKNLEAVRARSLAEWRQTPLGRVAGSTVGVLGFGSIGQAVARRAMALGAEVVATRRRPLPSPIAGVRLVADVREAVAAADHLVLALPSTAETRNLVDAHLLSHAKPTAHLINIGRGAVLDQQALLDALNGGRLAFATLDVTEPEPLPEDHALWLHPRVRLTPHVSSNYTNVRHVLFRQVADSLERFARGEAPADLVDVQAGY
jgi:phosphoglycerate dehydrogenase-like enzyme